ncbi:MAG TPA: hypothetical protein VIL18_13070 [Longimicrobiales bacterium]
MNAQERALVEKLLQRDFQGRDALRAQIESALVAWTEENGSPVMSFTVDDKAPRAEVELRVPLEAEGVAEDEDGVTIHLLLHVVDGFLRELELFREDGEPIKRMPTADSVHPAYD